MEHEEQKDSFSRLNQYLNFKLRHRDDGRLHAQNSKFSSKNYSIFPILLEFK